jgi:SAM-dependent methyltransferase
LEERSTFTDYRSEYPVGDLTVRQYGTSLSDIRSDHVKRYQFATKYVFDEESVLDAACGTGYGSWILAQQSKNVTGMDISEHALDWARKYWSGPEYILGDVQREKLGYHDAIVSFETLEHLAHPEWALHSFREAAPLLIASVPNQERYPFDPEKFKDDPYPHLKHYTPEEFEELLDKANFSVISKFCQKDKKGEITLGTDGMFLIYVCR